jgi:hypothetical protein
MLKTCVSGPARTGCSAAPSRHAIRVNNEKIQQILFIHISDTSGGD